MVRGTPARPWSSALHFVSQENEPRRKGQHLKGPAVLFSPEPQTDVFIKQNLLVDGLKMNSKHKNIPYLCLLSPAGLDWC